MHSIVLQNRLSAHPPPLSLSRAKPLYIFAKTTSPTAGSMAKSKPAPHFLALLHLPGPRSSPHSSATSLVVLDLRSEGIQSLPRNLQLAPLFHLLEISPFSTSSSCEIVSHLNRSSVFIAYSTCLLRQPSSKHVQELSEAQRDLSEGSSGSTHFRNSPRGPPVWASGFLLFRARP